MADNTRLPLGTEDGDTYASDDIGGVKFQRVKVALGDDNTNDGDVSISNPMPSEIVGPDQEPAFVTNANSSDGDFGLTTRPIARFEAHDGDTADPDTIAVIAGKTQITGTYKPIPLTPDGTTIQVAINGSNSDSVVVTGELTANAGTNLNTSALALETGGNLEGAATSLAVIDDWDESDRAKVNPIVGQAGVQGGSGGVSNTTQRVVLATDVALPAGTNAIGKLAANSGVDIGDVDVTSVGGNVTVVQGTGSNLHTVIDSGTVTTVSTVTAVTSITNTVPTKEVRASTSNVTTVADTASSTTLLASNANRLGASIQNDSSAVLYVKFGTTASATDYTVRMVQYAYYEVPFGYTGRIDGIWATDPGDGAARITELSA